MNKEDVGKSVLVGSPLTEVVIHEVSPSRKFFLAGRRDFQVTNRFGGLPGVVRGGYDSVNWLSVEVIVEWLQEK